MPDIFDFSRMLELSTRRGPAPIQVHWEDPYYPEFVGFVPQPYGNPPIAVLTPEGLGERAKRQYGMKSRGTVLGNAVINSYNNGWAIDKLRPFVYADANDKPYGIFAEKTSEMLQKLVEGDLNITRVGRTHIELLRLIDDELHNSLIQV